MSELFQREFLEVGRICRENETHPHDAVPALVECLYPRLIEPTVWKSIKPENGFGPAMSACFNGRSDPFLRRGVHAEESLAGNDASIMSSIDCSIGWVPMNRVRRPKCSGVRNSNEIALFAFGKFFNSHRTSHRSS